jgi:hypothetical protein
MTVPSAGADPSREAMAGRTSPFVDERLQHCTAGRTSSGSSYGCGPETNIAAARGEGSTDTHGGAQRRAFEDAGSASSRTRCRGRTAVTSTPAGTASRRTSPAATTKGASFSPCSRCSPSAALLSTTTGSPLSLVPLQRVARGRDQVERRAAAVGAVDADGQHAVLGRGGGIETGQDGATPCTRSGSASVAISGATTASSIGDAGRLGPTAAPVPVDVR